MSGENKNSLNEVRLGDYFRELRDFEPFKAQIELENKYIASCISKLQSLDLQEDTLAASYMRVRAELDVLKRLQKERARMAEIRHNSPSSAKGE